MMYNEGNNDNEPHTHAYKPLLVGWFMCAVLVREEGDDAPSTHPLL